MSTQYQPASPRSATTSSKNYQQQAAISNADSTIIGVTNSKQGITPLPTSSPGSKNGFSSTIIDSEANPIDSSKILGPEDEFGMPPAFDIKKHIQEEEEDDDNENTSNISSQGNDQQELHSHAIVPEDHTDDDSVFVSKPVVSKHENVLKVLTLSVMDHEQSKTVTIGRSSSMNDFQLTPKSGLISRQHLAVTYFPNSNSLRIKCYGKNGVIVNFPRELKYKLVRQLKDKIFELVPRDNHDSDSYEGDSNKEIVSAKGITSFVLNEKEICFIPYMTGLQLSFGAVSVELIIKHAVGDEKQKDDTAKTQKKKSEENNDSNGVNIPSSPLADVVEYDGNDKHDINSENLQAKLLSEDDSSNKLQKKSNSKRHQEDVVSSPSSTKKQKVSSPKAQSPVTMTKRQALENLMNKLNSFNVSIKEWGHLLTNHIAFAPVQQIPLKQLYESNNTICSQLSLPEFKTFTEILLLELEPSIQMIPRQGKDAAGKLLDPEFFYDVEKDTNEERVLIVGSLKGGRSGLRSCRKTHKQYFWKKPTK
ncbi:hypothetical protein ACO0SA_002583 [Hanseniaspora valbyensis]